MLYTIGYESAALDDFVATLQAAGVSTLIDIRERAQSRRKGFSKTALSEALSSEGISYRHYRELGDPKAGREAARAGDWRTFRSVFSNVMASERAKVAMSEIEELASHQAVCLLCYERDPLTCHRKIVSDELETRLDVKTTHLGVQLGKARKAA
eukprot:Skav231764  [mRNA]  locus=scaffold7660:554:1015:- [translate_table: standard]